MVLCSVIGCPTRHNDTNISFHNLPKDENLRESWLQASTFGWTEDKRKHICSRHFKPESYRTKNKCHLRPGAVPTIFQDYESYVEVPPAPMEAVLHDHNYYFYICETEMVFCEDKETSIKEDLSLAVKTEDDPLSVGEVHMKEEETYQNQLANERCS